MYIDGVFSGGGIKGFALIGAYEALEKKGFQLKRVAGTSAGAIISSLVIAGYKSTEMTKIMNEVNLSDFLDARKMIIPFPIAKWLFLYKKLGLYKGEALEAWLEEILAAKGVVTFGDLPPGSLKLVASDLTRGTFIVLPDDLRTYGINPDTFSVARAVRMSCSLPYFFEPVKLRPPTGYSLVVDGGVLSNFPIWLFDNGTSRQERPILGIKLSANTKKEPVNKINNAIDLFSSLFDTMMKAHDLRYISRKHEKNIVFIPVESGLTTDFSLNHQERDKLITFGREKTEKFLKTWTY
ncbi:patatin-like phospholipase family protein [Bacillus sp. PS06]|uniref:patatin-like phospholipase family protein n=1 Tax=Bacillus sp. PS06 TaxID=2764176 RepID=UPI00177EB936|nr:patatin-like phospholipase family protein [Bacillus sp. PS06]MBD8070416.1 patatin-like phospholipase family protein [Bacillus sp. PS06]